MVKDPITFDNKFKLATKFTFPQSPSQKSPFHFM